MSKTPLIDTALVIEQIADERLRQIEIERHTHRTDKKYVAGELAMAAMAYCQSSLPSEEFGVPLYNDEEASFWWPPNWDPAAFKRKGARADLVRAAALIVAEIERLDRAAK